MTSGCVPPRVNTSCSEERAVTVAPGERKSTWRALLVGLALGVTTGWFGKVDGATMYAPALSVRQARSVVMRGVMSMHILSHTAPRRVA